MYCFVYIISYNIKVKWFLVRKLLLVITAGHRNLYTKRILVKTAGNTREWRCHEGLHLQDAVQETKIVFKSQVAVRTQDVKVKTYI